MAVPRAQIVDPNEPGLYHCFSRCVRRAFLMGPEHDHRRAWIEQRLEFLCSIFAVDDAAHSAMSNHLHVLVRIDPPRVDEWSDSEVVRRSSRPMTSTSVNWSPAAWDTVGEAGLDQRTPDLSAMIQEVVDRDGWAAGNAIVIKVDGTGKRTAESHNGDAAKAPLLTVTYKLGSPIQQRQAGADVNGDGRVDVRDVLSLLSAWGACEACPEDINHDGMVDFADMLEVLANQ